MNIDNNEYLTFKKEFFFKNNILSKRKNKRNIIRNKFMFIINRYTSYFMFWS